MPVRALVSTFGFLSIAAGCVSDPTFEQANGASTTTDATTSANRDMVLVSATTLTTLATKEIKGKGKRKGDDDDDEKKPASPPPAPKPRSPNESSPIVPASPSPAPKPRSPNESSPIVPASPPPAPNPGGPTESSLVVPSFWIDAAAVTPVAYDACVKGGVCSPPSCESLDATRLSCITHAQASTYCAWTNKRMVCDAEWTAAAKQMPAGLTGLSGGFGEWVDDANGIDGIVRGGATSNASMTLGLASSIPTVGFRCARDR